LSESEKESKKQTERIRKRVLNGSLVISAGAGTGKTYNLIEAYLSAVQKLKGESVDRVFDMILAITFTNAATYEFKRRVQREILKDKSDMEPFLTSQEISTIHSACQRILSTLALDLGLNPATEVFEEDQDTNYALELIDEIVGDAVDSGDKGVLDLLSRYDYNGFEFRAGLKDILLGFHSKTRSRGWSVQDTVKNCRRAVDSLNSTLGSPKATLDRWLTSSHIVRNTAQTLLASQILREAATVSNEFLELYEKFATRFEREKQLSGNISHDDSLYYVNVALQVDPNRDQIKEHLKSKHRVVLVDEYQDTDPIQDSIIEDISPDKGVFRVGDVKQSIFRFRRAEPSIFQGRVSKAEKKAGELESLVHNRRSRHALVAFTNYVFRRVFDGSFLPRNGLGGVKFEELKPARDRPIEEKELDPWAPVEVFRVARQPMDSMCNDEATFIARRIRELVGNFPVYSKKENTVVFAKCRYKDIAILLRTKGRLQTYLDELRNNNIPFIVRDNPGFFDQYEVDLLITFLRYLSSPSDRFLKSVLLRSAIFGISDKTLFKMTQNKGVIDDTLLSSIHDSKDVELLKKFKAVSDELQGKRSFSKRNLLQEVIRISNLDLLCYSTVTGPQAYANILKLVDVGGSFDKELNGSLDAFIDWLDDMKETTKQDQAEAYDEDSDAVKIMTIHASKGLEFPVVFVPLIFRDFWNPAEDYFVSDNAKLKLADGSEPKLPFLLKPGDSGRSGQTATQANLIARNLFDGLTSQEDEEFTNEEWRLLYVAFTRARDLLMFSVSPDSAKEKLHRFAAWRLSGRALTTRIASEDWNIRLLQIMPGLANQGEVRLATK
jgi:ATP-dependent helicase/nuclease subunit A